LVRRKDKLSHAMDSIMLPGSGQTEETNPVVPETKPVVQDAKAVAQEAKAVIQEAHAVVPEGKKQLSGKVKTTYYVSKELIQRLKDLAAETDRDLSNLVNEAIKELLIKYGK
jgi:Ribbon-helix-helix domain